MILSNLVSYVVQAAVLLAVGLAAPRLLGLRRMPRVSLRYWQLLLALLLLLPVLQPWREPLDGSVVVQLVGLAASDSASAAVSPATAGRIGWWIVAACAAFSAVRLTWITLGLRALRSLERDARPLGVVSGPVADVARRLGVTARMMTSGRVPVPVTFGWRRPTVLLPPWFDELPERQQVSVACHELLHVRRGDWLVGVAEQVARAVLWFHPGVTVLLARIGLAREQLVDAEVVRITGDRRSYLDVLWDIARVVADRPHAPVVPLLRRSDLFERVAALTGEVNMSKKRLAYAVTAVAGLLMAAGVTVAIVFPFVESSPAVAAAAWAPPGLSGGSSERPAADTLRYEEDGDITEPRIISKVNPRYPEEARKNRLTGVVVCEAVITAAGEVADVKIVRTADEVFNEPTIEAISQWRFEPATLDGEPVDVYYVLTVKYSLSKDKPKSDEAGS